MSKIRQIGRLVDVLLQSGGVRAVRSWKPFSLTSFQMLRALQREGVDFHAIVDGGANKGQFARAAAETFPEAAVFAFEPLPEVASTLRQNLADCPRVHVFEAALGQSSGTIAFYRHPYSLASSVLPPDDDDVVVEQIDVPVVRLDDALKPHVFNSPALLKLDLQGYEIEALRGAPKTLASTDYVLLETSFEPHYLGEPSFQEVLDFMRESGFDFVRPLDFLRRDDEAIVQMDALFARRGM